MRWTRYGLALLLVLGLAAPGSAQTSIFAIRPQTGSATLNTTSAGTCDATSCVVVLTGGFTTVGVQTTGTCGSCTLAFETTVDGSNWVAVQLFPPTSTTGVTTISTAGQWQGGVIGTKFRVRQSGRNSGGFVVNVYLTLGSPDSLTGGGGGDLTATYLLQTADASLPNAQAMGALSTGLLYNTTTTGVQASVVCTSGVLQGGAPPTCTTTPALGTPSSITLTNGTGLPVGGITGFGTGIATFLATPSSANLFAAVTDETGSGALVGANTPTLVTPVIGAATGTSLVLSPGTNTTGLIVTGGTVNTGITPFVSITGTWNTSSAPPALFMNITNTASGSALLADFQTSTVSQFSVSKAGAGYLAGSLAVGAAAGLPYTFRGFTGTASNLMGVRATSNNYTVGATFSQGSNDGVSGAGQMFLGWDGTTTGGFAPDGGTQNFLMSTYYGSAFHSVMSVALGTMNVTFGGTINSGSVTSTGTVRANTAFSANGTAGVTVSACTAYTFGLCTTGTSPEALYQAHAPMIVAGLANAGYALPTTEQWSEVLALRAEVAALKAQLNGVVR